MKKKIKIESEAAESPISETDGPAENPLPGPHPEVAPPPHSAPSNLPGLAGATSDAPQGGKNPTAGKDAGAPSEGEILEYEVFEHRVVGECIEAIEVGGGRTICAAQNDCKVIGRAEGQRYDRIQVRRGRYSIG